MKKQLFLFLSALLLTASSAFAYDFSTIAPSGQTLYYNISGNSATVTFPHTYYYDWSGYTMPTGDLIIPSSVTHNEQTYSVTSIGSSAFSNCSGLTSVSISNSITTISNWAFSNCSGLTSLTIPNSVTSIGEYAFSDCSGLTSLIIPNSVTAIGERAFSSCSGLTSLTIPNSMTSIDNSAFSNCTGLSSLTIPNSVTSIGGGAFSRCTSLTSVTIPNSVTSIGESTFWGCSGLTSVNIPNSVTSIGEGAFAYCTGLTSVTIPNSVTTIGDNAFVDCRGLTSVTIGSSVSSICVSAFYGCSGLTSITSKANPAPQLETDAFTGVSSTIPINVPCGSSMSYYSRWPYFSNFVEESGFTFCATSSDSTKGSVQILTEPTCTNPTAVLYAAANEGYRFDHWSDGNTDTPRTIVQTSDTTLIAYFESTQAIEDATNKAAFVIRTIGTRIVVEGIANETVRLFDCMGRCLQTVRATEGCTFQVPAPGVYMLQAGHHPAQRVVVVK